MRVFLVLSAFLQGWLAVLFLLGFALIATRRDGFVIINWNRYGAMWAEVVALGLIAVLYPFALWFVSRRLR